MVRSFRLTVPGDRVDQLAGCIPGSSFTSRALSEENCALDVPLVRDDVLHFREIIKWILVPFTLLVTFDLKQHLLDLF